MKAVIVNLRHYLFDLSPILQYKIHIFSLYRQQQQQQQQYQHRRDQIEHSILDKTPDENDANRRKGKNQKPTTTTTTTKRREDTRCHVFCTKLFY